MLARWHLGDPPPIAAAVTQGDHASPLSPDEVEAFRPFFSRRGQSGAASRRARLAHARRAGKTAASHATAPLRLEELSLHPHPAGAPGRFPGGDAAVSRHRSSRASSGSPTLIAAMGGLLLALRQWEAFTTTFLHLFQLAGTCGVSPFALIITKIAHELAHAHARETRRGCPGSHHGRGADGALSRTLYRYDRCLAPHRSAASACGSGYARMAIELAIAAWMTLALERHARRRHALGQLRAGHPPPGS